MKKLVLIVIGFVLVLGCALVAVPFLIPMETVKRELVARVKEATGRDLTIAGEMKTSIYPTLGVQVQEVRLSNPKGYSTPDMLHVKKLTVEVALMPLIHGDLQLKSFILEKPVINLEVDARGKPNWVFNAAPVALREKPFRLRLVSDANASEAPGSGMEALKNLHLGKVEVSDGMVSYRNALVKRMDTAEAVNVKIRMPSLNDALTIDGDARWNGDTVKLEAKAQNAQALLDGKPTGAEFNIHSAHGQAAFSGKASLAGAEGPINLQTPSLPALAKWVGAPFDWKGKTPLAFNANGDLKCAGEQCTLKNAALALDDIKGKGELSAQFGGSVPAIFADLNFDSLDVNPYLTASISEGPTLYIVSPAYASEPSAGWSTERMDFSGLRAVNAEVNIKTQSVAIQKVKFGATEMKAKLSGGVLKLNIPSTQLYDGKASADFIIDAYGIPAIDYTIKLSGVQAMPLLKDAAEFDRLSGTMEMTARGNTRGESQAQMIGALNGDGMVKFTDGAVHGINLAQMARNVGSAFTGSGGSQKTDFAELGGTYIVTGGVMKNDDLTMKAPLVRVLGKGEVNLPKQVVNYRLEPTLVGTLEGQGGKDKTGITVPIIVAGTFDHLTFTPDLQSTVQEVLKDPKKAKETLKNVRDQLKQELKGGEGGKTDLKDLLKGFGR